jgi:hypothetical protein
MKNAHIHTVFVVVILGLLVISLPAGPARATDHSGSITVNTTWYAADNPHVIVDDVSVADSTTLTLEDGVEVYFDPGMDLTVSYNLIAEGTSGNGILFTRNGASNGGKIGVGEDATFAYCTIESLNIGLHTGGGADTVSVSHCTFQDCHRGIWMEGGRVEMISCTVAGNSEYGLKGENGSVVPVFLDGNNVFENNYRGMWIRYVSGLSLTTGATFRNNTKVGLRLEHCTSNATIDHMIFESNDGLYGALYLESCGEFTLGSSNTFGGTGVENSWPVTINAPSFPSAASSGHIPTTGNTNNGIQVYGGWVSSDTVTWRSLGVDYIVTNYPNFSGTLEIEDGVTVKFDHEDYLRIGGTLNAVGSSGILFTRYQPDDQWAGLYFQSGSSGRLRHCTIEYANRSGNAGIYASEAFPSIEHCTLRNNYYGIRARDAAWPVLDTANIIQDNEYVGICFDQCTNPSLSNQTLTGHDNTYGAIYMTDTGEFTIGPGNTIGGLGQENSWPLTIDIGSYPSPASSGHIPSSGNTHNDIQVCGSSSDRSVTWPQVGCDYVVTGNPVVSEGGTLSIGDSVTVRFDNSRYLRVYGTLDAIGTGSILFTRYEPDDQWQGLQFQSGSSGTLRHCTIEHATYSITGYGVYANGAFPDIEHCTIRDNDYGVYATNVTALSLDTANTIQDNGLAGICCTQCTDPSLSNQILTGHDTPYSGSTYYGAIYMKETGEFTIGDGNTIGGPGQENSWPVTIDIGSWPSQVSDGHIPDSGNNNNGIQVLGDETAGSATWYELGVDYVVTSSPKILAGGTLTVSDSVTVRFDDADYLRVEGTLNAVGTGSILFTRYEPDDEWSGLRFYNGSGGTLRHCTIEHATAGYEHGGVYADGAFPSIERCTIRESDRGIFAENVASPVLDTANLIQDNEYTGIYFYNCTDASISNQTLTGHSGDEGAIHMSTCGRFTIGEGNVIGGAGQENSWPVTIDLGSWPSQSSLGRIPDSGNTENAIQVDGGYSADSVAWFPGAVDYVVTDHPTVQAGEILVIEDGVTVRFGGSKYLSISGTLTATGIPDTGIVFTGHGGSTWEGLKFNSGGRGELNSCTIESSNYGVRTYAGADSIFLDHCTLQNNGYGVYAQGGAFDLINNRIIGNASYGIYLAEAVPITFGSSPGEWNDIYDNGSGEGKDLRNGTLDTHAPYVYWGTVISSEIETRIWDVKDDGTLGEVCYAPWCNAAHDQTTALWLSIDIDDGAKSGRGDIRLDWTEYCGQAVDHYVVYRGTTAAVKGDSLAGTTDLWYLDAGTAGDTGTNYYYTVEVVDSLGQRFDSNQVGEFDVGLINGLKTMQDQRRGGAVQSSQ